MAIDRNATAKETSRGEVKPVNPKDIHLGLAASTGASTGWCSRVCCEDSGSSSRLKATSSVRLICWTTRHSPTTGRETAIIRQTCLKAAAEFCAPRPQLRTADLFALAERMEAWVTR